MDAEIWVITGWQGRGKTTFCKLLIEAAQRTGWDVSGMYSPAVYKKGMKESIHAVDIRSGVEKPLASMIRQSPMDLSLGKWYYSLQTLEWGNQALLAGAPCDLFVIDELGPLELNLSQGWTNALRVIRRANFKLALVVVRPELLSQVHLSLEPTHYLYIDRIEEAQAMVDEHLPWLEHLKVANPAGG
ncbi:MAG: nucleoside-triphosphatase [Anaerolineaceae bacterium]